MSDETHVAAGRGARRCSPPQPGGGLGTAFPSPLSARREMFVRLLRAESQLKNLTDRWPGVIFSQRADFSFRFVSPQIERLTGVAIHHWQAKPQLF